MLSGEMEKAISAIRMAFLEAAESPITIDSDVDAICSPRISGLLDGIGVTTIKQLIELTANELSEIPQLGGSSVDTIEENLDAVGFSLRK